MNRDLSVFFRDLFIISFKIDTLPISISLHTKTYTDYRGIFNNFNRGIIYIKSQAGNRIGMNKTVFERAYIDNN